MQRRARAAGAARRFARCAYLELGRLNEAIAEYQRVLRLNPNMAMARYHLARALEREGEVERARAELERFLTIWQDADSDAATLVDARRRLAALGAG